MRQVAETMNRPTLDRIGIILCAVLSLSFVQSALGQADRPVPRGDTRGRGVGEVMGARGRARGEAMRLRGREIANLKSSEGKARALRQSQGASAAGKIEDEMERLREAKEEAEEQKQERIQEDQERVRDPLE